MRRGKGEHWRVGSGRVTQACRLTGQSFLIFLPSRSSGAVERRPGAFDRVVVSGGGLGHRRVGVDTFPTGGVPLRVPGGFREDRRSQQRWSERESGTSELSVDAQGLKQGKATAAARDQKAFGFNQPSG